MAEESEYLDTAKLEAIQECLAKGNLAVRVSEVDFAETGRLTDPYQYD